MQDICMQSNKKKLVVKECREDCGGLKQAFDQAAVDLDGGSCDIAGTF